MRSTQHQIPHANVLPLGLDHPEDGNHYLSRTLAVMEKHQDLPEKQLIYEVARQLSVVPHVALSFVKEVNSWMQRERQHQTHAAATCVMPKPRQDNNLDTLIAFLEREISVAKPANGMTD